MVMDGAAASERKGHAAAKACIPLVAAAWAALHEAILADEVTG